jgi:hypothetical protein
MPRLAKLFPINEVPIGTALAKEGSLGNLPNNQTRPFGDLDLGFCPMGFDRTRNNSAQPRRK